MTVLPLKSIHEEDVPVIGKNLYNLAKLQHLDFPVPQGYVVTPPAITLQTILEHFNFKEKEVFEQKLIIVKKEVQKIDPPKELMDVLYKSSIQVNEIWQKFLAEWIEEIRSIIWREGFVHGITSRLQCKLILFTPKQVARTSAYYDPTSRQIVLQDTIGTIPTAQFDEMGVIIQKANKKLFLPQVYQFMLVPHGKSIKVIIVKIRPYTDTIKDQISSPTSVDLDFEQTPAVKSAMKVFLNPKSRLVVEKNIDGVLIDAVETGDFEKQVFQLSESALLFPHGAVIFRLSDKQESFGGVRGAQRLLHQRDLLKSEADAFLFVRNKRQLLNVHIALPFVRSVEEFMALKRELASMGVARKGTLKMWFEVCVPENIINLHDYIEVGFDGVIINLDELAAWFGGFDHTQPESISYKKQLSGLFKFLQPACKKLNNLGKPILLTGDLAIQGDVLPHVMEMGIWGVVVGTQSAAFIQEELKFLEKRMVHKRVPMQGSGSTN